MGACLCDSSITRRFLGSDAAAGIALLLAGGGLVVCWLDCGRERVGWGDCTTDSCEAGAVIAGVGGSEVGRWDKRGRRMVAIYGADSFRFFVIGIALSAAENLQVSYSSPSFL